MTLSRTAKLSEPMPLTVPLCGSADVVDGEGVLGGVGDALDKESRGGAVGASLRTVRLALEVIVPLEAVIVWVSLKVFQPPAFTTPLSSRVMLPARLAALKAQLPTSVEERSTRDSSWSNGFQERERDEQEFCAPIARTAVPPWSFPHEEVYRKWVSGGRRPQCRIGPAIDLWLLYTRSVRGAIENARGGGGVVKIASCANLFGLQGGFRPSQMGFQGVSA